MGITNPRDPRKLRVGFAHQEAFATGAPTTGTVVYAQAEVVGADTRTEYLDPRGTTGSEFGRSSKTSIAKEPRVTLRLHATSRPALALLQEHATHGQPTATEAAGDVGVGVLRGNLDLFLLQQVALTGIRPVFNADATNRLYVSYQGATPSPGNATISLYSDAAQTQLVAQGSGTYASTITLAAQNGSGLSATIFTNSLSPTQQTTAYYLSVTRVRPARAAQIARWFTTFVDTGNELETLTGCTVARLEIMSDGNGGARVEVDIVAATYARGPHDANLAHTVTSADLEKITHRAAALTHNGNAQSVWSARHGIRHEIWAPTHNSATPVAVVKLSSDLLPIVFSQRISDEAMAVLADGLAATYRALSVVYSIGTRQWSWSYGFALQLDPNMPIYRDGKWENIVQTMDAREQNAASPADPLTVFLDL